MEESRPGHHVSLGRWELPIELLVVANLIALAIIGLAGALVYAGALLGALRLLGVSLSALRLRRQR